jgi:hypothetical protein
LQLILSHSDVPLKSDLDVQRIHLKSELEKALAESVLIIFLDIMFSKCDFYNICTIWSLLEKQTGSFELDTCSRNQYYKTFYGRNLRFMAAEKVCLLKNGLAYKRLTGN